MFHLTERLVCFRHRSDLSLVQPCLCLFVIAGFPGMEARALRPADPQIEQARHYLDTGQLQRAEVLLNEVVKSDPANFEAHRLLGLSYAQEQRFPDAVVHLNLGRVYLKLHRTDAAVDVLEELLQVSPGDWRRQLDVGKMFFDNFLYESAKPPLIRAWELNRDSYEAGFYVALVHYLLGEQAESLAALIELKAKGQQTLEAENLLGAVYAKLGQTDQAVALL